MSSGLVFVFWHHPADASAKFQDLTWQRNYGLYHANGTAKPAILNTFQAFNPTPSYASIPQPPNYYNIWGYGPFSISGVVSDQNSNPIKNAVIMANVNNGFTGFTFSQANGWFTLNSNAPISSVYWTAMRAEAKENFTPGTGPIGCYLDQWQPTAYISLTGFVAGTNLFYESDNLITASCLLSSAGPAIFKAGTKIDLQPGFKVTAGHDFHAYTAPMFADCNLVNASYSRLAPTKDSLLISSNDLSDTLNILSSGKNYSDTTNEIILYPNPSSDFLNLKVPNKDYTYIASVEIYDNLGRTYDVPKSMRISITELPKGFYQLRLHFIDGSIVVKTFIKQ